MPERIIVSGIYRSGTSLTTGLIGEWGAYTGRGNDIFQDQYGYLEHMTLQKFNDELLGENSRVPTPVDQLLKKSHDTELRERALRILDDMDREAAQNDAKAWVWKDPRLPMALPFWAGIWGDVIYVIPVRHPVETIHSAAAMEGLSPADVPLSAGFVYWQFCMLNILNFTQTSQRKLFIAYDQLVQHPQRECERLCQFLDLQCGLDQGTMMKRAKSMASRVSVGRQHHQSPASLADLDMVTAEQRALYNFLRVKTIHPDESYNPLDFALYPGWMEYLQAMDMLVTSMAEMKESRE